jgi:hypothetical protein
MAPTNTVKASGVGASLLAISYPRRLFLLFRRNFREQARSYQGEKGRKKHSFPGKSVVFLQKILTATSLIAQLNPSFVTFLFIAKINKQPLNAIFCWAEVNKVKY